MSFGQARKIADAVLYEGYVLYPYRASAAKNQLRWQFGVVVPRGYSELGGEPWVTQTECLIEPVGKAALAVRLRFLQLQSRIIEQLVDRSNELFTPVEHLDLNGQSLVTWDQGLERELDLPVLDLAEIIAAERVVPFEIDRGREVEFIRDAAGQIHGRIIRERWPIAGAVRVAGEAMGSVVKVRIMVENLSPWSGGDPVERAVALRHSLIGAHTLLGISDGLFVSLLDPPEWARAAAASCVNRHTWPVLVGAPEERYAMLSSPIILYDYPQIAPESQGDMCDGTEIDEILTLRTMTLTEDEKREARGTDQRAAAIIERADTMPGEILERLHGAVRYLRKSTSHTQDEQAQKPWWNPEMDTSVSPSTDSVQINGVAVAKGSHVRLRPGQRRADAQDIFLDQKIALVEAVFADVEDKQYLAVTLIDDPAADLNRWHGRYLYFYPDEVEPLEANAKVGIAQERNG